MTFHVRTMRWLNRLRHIRRMWGPKAVAWYFWRFVYEEPKPQPTKPRPRGIPYD